MKTNTMLISTLYKGVHYDLIKPYKQDIIQNHKRFAEFNDMKYRLYGDEVPYRYNLTGRTFSDYNIPINAMRVFPGIGKLYTILSAIEDYPEMSYFVFADFDSVFMEYKKLDDVDNCVLDQQCYKNHVLTVSCRQKPYLYDTSFLYYYCMYTGMTFEDIKTLRYRYNSGLVILNKKIITETMVNDYVNFCIEIHKHKQQYFITEPQNTHAMTLPYEEISSSGQEHLLFHPSDEVFFQWLQMRIKSNGDFIAELKPSWNQLHTDTVFDINNAYHVHCINKEIIPTMLELSNV
jgi:hypothetical protein